MLLRHAGLSTFTETIGKEVAMSKVITTIIGLLAFLGIAKAEGRQPADIGTCQELSQALDIQLSESARNKEEVIGLLRSADVQRMVVERGVACGTINLESLEMMRTWTETEK